MVATRSRWARLLRGIGTAALVPACLAAQVGMRDSVVYLPSAASVFEVKTGKAGLFGFAGHDHVVRARTFSGQIVYFPDAPWDSRVTILVAAESLAVLTPPDTAEIRKVAEAMRSEILHVDHYPDITFQSKGVTLAGSSVAVRGELTLAGETRDVSVDLRVEIGPDTLRATGSFAIEQTDFGIRPYRGGPGGTVRVADRVTITVDVVGIRVEQP